MYACVCVCVQLCVMYVCVYATCMYLSICEVTFHDPDVSRDILRIHPREEGLYAFYTP